jgi:toxin-antitoxin system PIN domain toxin
VILVDANLLLYAYDSSSAEHSGAAPWLEQVFAAEETVGFALVTLLAFLRISTSGVVFRDPLTPSEAVALVMSWLELPLVRVAQPTDRHWSLLDTLVVRGQAKGPLLMDAHVAALAIEHGATLCTTDRDFARFPGLRVRNPLDGSA